MGITALHLAAHRNCPGICELLIRQGANPCIQDESGQSPIILAVTGGHYDSTQVILGSLLVDIGHKYVNFEERTLLHLAANDGHTDICELLVETFGGTSYINEGDKEQRTPLHLASIWNHQPTCKLLISRNADITAVDKDKMTPLHHAARENNDVILKILLTKARGAYGDIHQRQTLQFVNATTDDGSTALHFAMKKAKQDVYEPLIAFKANPFFKNQAGMSPFLVAVQNAKSDDIHSFFELLREYSYHITKLTSDQDSDGNTALHIAAKKDKKDICESLVNKYEADFTAKNKNDYVPLHFAATLKRPGICKFLLDNAPDLVDARGKDGVTPLHMAAHRGSDKVCKLLLERGSQINAEDQAGDTPLHYAARRGDDKICSALVKCGADALAANKNGDIPEDIWPEDNRSAAKTLKRERKKQADEELMKTGERPVEIVKLLIVGHPEAGKTTLKNSMDQEKYMVEEGSYTPTPGITVERKPVGSAGQFSVWDCAGQMEYHVTHGMFLGAQNAIFLVVYDLFREMYEPSERRAKLGQLDEIYYWLAFVKAVNRFPDEKTKPPLVALVATHVDLVPADMRDYYMNLAADNIRRALSTFGEYLDISKDMFILGTSSDMTDFHTKLETLTNSIRKRKIKGLCYKIEQNKNTWRTAGPPIIPYMEYCQEVEQVEGVSDVTERLIRAATTDLHDMGVIYRVHLHGTDDYIVLDPNWLFSTVVGRLFASSDMPRSHPRLDVKKQWYRLCEIRDVLQITDVDVRLLMTFMMELELAVQFGNDGKYLIPAKLPSEMDSHVWKQYPDPPCNEIYGRRIRCKDSILDIYTPTTFPCVQARLMKRYGPHVIPVQNRLKFTANGMSVLVQMTADKQGIDVIVRGRGEEDRYLCFERLREAVGGIWGELSYHSPGNSSDMFFLSSSALKECSPLSTDYRQMRTFTVEDLVNAEKQHAGKVYHDATVLDKYDQVEDIVCLGYDPFFITQLGLECNSKWIPFCTLKKMDDCLCSDEAVAEGTCYKFLAFALGFTGPFIRTLEKRCTAAGSRITAGLIQEWLRSKGKERKLGNLRATIAHPGLVGNTRAVDVFDDLLKKHDDDGSQDPENGQLPSDIMMPPAEVLASRAALRLSWGTIRRGTRTTKLYALLQDVLTPEDREELEYYMNILGPMRTADRLAPMLLSKPNCSWFRRLLQAFELADEERFGDIGRQMKTDYEAFFRKYVQEHY